MKEAWRQTWENAELGKKYGEVLYQRAIGELPEMESSIAFARRISLLIKDGDTILDVGCGAGHYYLSLKRACATNFFYEGVDATESYVKLGRLAFANDRRATFSVGDIFNLAPPDGSYDIVSCSNVLLHLPNIRIPISELIRVARRHVLIRTPIGLTSYVIQDVTPQDGGDEFDEGDMPKTFHFLNIYSKDYVARLLNKNPRVKSFQLDLDTDYSPERISDTGSVIGGWDTTQAINGMQVSGMVILPWTWVSIELE